MISGPFGSSKQPRHECRHALPTFRLRQKLLTSAARERVILRLAVVVRDAPLRGDPPALFEPQQSGIKRALIKFEQIGGNLLNAQGDAVAVQRAESIESL